LTRAPTPAIHVFMSSTPVSTPRGDPPSSVEVERLQNIIKQYEEDYKKLEQERDELNEELDHITDEYEALKSAVPASSNGIFKNIET
jgi:hypothetical protein